LVAISEGMRVRSDKFGEGIVVSVKGDGDGREARVLFDDGGERRLLLRFATLRPAGVPKRLSEVAPSTAPNADAKPKLHIVAWDSQQSMLCPSCGSAELELEIAPVKRQRARRICLSGTCVNGCEFEIGLASRPTYVGSERKNWSLHAIVKEKRPAYRFDSEVERQFWDAYIQAVDFHTYGGESLAGLLPQYKFGSYRLDFAIPDIKFAIEIDGLAYHNGQDSFMRDRKRQRDLEADGWRVIRFAAKEVMNDAWQCVMESAEQADRVRQS
jgi:hypothetical protein